MRYYQSVIDVDILAPGVDYQKLKKSFVIFICNYDPFGQQRYLYTFENYCREDRALYLGDETQKVIVNTRGAVGEISKELREIIEYLDSETITGAYTAQLDTAVKQVKASEERRHEYMVKKIHEMEVREEGREEGILGTVEILHDLGFDDETIKQKIIEKYELDPEEAENYLNMALVKESA